MHNYLAKVVGKRGPPLVNILVGLKGEGDCAIRDCVEVPIYSTGKREPFQDDFCRVAVLVCIIVVAVARLAPTY